MLECRVVLKNLSVQFLKCCCNPLMKVVRVSGPYVDLHICMYYSITLYHNVLYYSVLTMLRSGHTTALASYPGLQRLGTRLTGYEADWVRG